MSSASDLFSGWPPQVLDPAGPGAASVAVMTWILVGMGVAVSLLVLFGVSVALSKPGALRRWFASEAAVLAGGLALPALVLTALLSYSLLLTSELTAAPPADAMRIRVVGEQWWWRVQYLDGDRVSLETANEIVIPAGAPVVLELESADVIHSFWVPRLGGKLDMIPGRTNVMPIEADQPGLYGGQCAEYCGGAHAWMKFSVRALPHNEFDVWRARQLTTAPAPSGARMQHGAALFIEQGCGECHALRGVSAGVLGPDLNHLASRATLAAGLFPMNEHTLAQWIANAQQLKPGNRMPSYDHLSEPDLEALAAYLGSLE